MGGLLHLLCTLINTGLYLPLGSLFLILLLFTGVNLCLIFLHLFPLGLHIAAFSCELIFMFRNTLLRCDAGGA